MTRSVVHSGHEPGPRAIQSALCGYRAAGVITVGYTGLSRAKSAGLGEVSRTRLLHQILLDGSVGRCCLESLDLRVGAGLTFGTCKPLIGLSVVTVPSVTLCEIFARDL